MNVLLIGSGGREHALAWKIAQSPHLDALYAAPGNPGIAQEATCIELDVTDHDAVAAFCKEKDVALVVGHVLRRQPNVFVWAGDNVYQDARAGVRHAAPVATGAGRASQSIGVSTNASLDISNDDTGLVALDDLLQKSSPPSRRPASHAADAQIMGEGAATEITLGIDEVGEQAAATTKPTGTSVPGWARGRRAGSSGRACRSSSTWRPTPRRRNHLDIC